MIAAPDGRRFIPTHFGQSEGCVALNDEINRSTPERGLVEIFETTRGRLPERGDPARRIAVTWLTELYGAVHSWNSEFISFLKQYPGFKSSEDPSEYKKFLVDLHAYRVALNDRSPQVKRALCSKLHRLYARFDRDFAGMASKDPDAYQHLKGIVESAYAGEDAVISMAGSIIWDVMREFEVGYQGSWEGVPLHAPLHEWHASHHEQVCKLILAYERGSAEAVETLAQLADEAGLDFAGLEDFAENYAAEPTVVFQGGVTTVYGNMTTAGGDIATIHGDYNRNEGGVQIVGSTTGPISIIQAQDPLLKDALDEIGAFVKSTGNAAAEAMHESLVEEAAKDEPEPARLKQFWDGLVGLAPGVKALSGAAAAVMALFV